VTPAGSPARGLRRGLAALLALLCLTGPGIAAEFGRPPWRDVEERNREERGRTGTEAKRSEFERNLDRDYRNHLEHLDPDHYDAYRRERNGESLGVNPRTGAPWDHITEVRDAQRGVENAIAATKARLSDPRIGHEERERLQAKPGEMSNTPGSPSA
jgi:hypothetical protein